MPDPEERKTLIVVWVLFEVLVTMCYRSSSSSSSSSNRTISGVVVGADSNSCCF